MITTPEIICDVFSFLDKDQIERIQLVSQFWNNVMIRHKNILPLRQFYRLDFNFNPNIILLYAIKEEFRASYKINFDGTNLSKIEEYDEDEEEVDDVEDEGEEEENEKEEDVPSKWYSQLTVDEVLKNLNDIVFDKIIIGYHNSENCLDDLLNLMKLVTTKNGGRFRGKFGQNDMGRFGSKLDEIFDNYIIVDELELSDWNDSYIREVCANPEIVQFPSTPKEIRLGCLIFKENEEVLHFTCNGKLNEANRLTIHFFTLYNENFIRQWFEIYLTHQNPISLVGKFELRHRVYYDSVLDALKTLLNNTELRVKYSLERLHSSFYGVTNQYVKRSCVLHETNSYALVIEIAYKVETGEVDINSINASDLDQPPWNKMESISFCVKSL